MADSSTRPPDDEAAAPDTPPSSDAEASYAAGVDRVLRLTTELARSLIGAHQGAAGLITKGDWAGARAYYSLSEKYARWANFQTSPEGKGVHGLVVTQNQPMRMTQEELEAHPEWQQFGSTAAEHPPMRGWLSVPLQEEDGCNCGLVQLSDKYDGSEFSAEDEEQLLQLAELASVALAALGKARKADTTVDPQPRYEQGSPDR